MTVRCSGLPPLLLTCGGRPLRIGLVDEVVAGIDAAQERLEAPIHLMANERSLYTEMASKTMIDGPSPSYLGPPTSYLDRSEGLAAFVEKSCRRDPSTGRLRHRHNRRRARCGGPAALRRRVSGL